MLNSYQAYAILEGTAVRPLREIPGENRTCKGETIRDAMWEYTSGTYSEYEIEGILIAALVRKGANKASARRWVLQFLDS